MESWIRPTGLVFATCGRELLEGEGITVNSQRWLQQNGKQSGGVQQTRISTGTAFRQLELGVSVLLLTGCVTSSKCPQLAEP